MNFCKFTNETRNGIEDATDALRPDLDRRGQRHRRGRRLRAGAGLRPDPAGRRPLLGRLAARGAAARRAARHRRPHPRGRQAARAPGPRRRLRHPARRASAASRPSSGGWSTRWSRKRQWDEKVRERAAAGRSPVAPPDRRRRASRCRRCSARRPRTASSTATSRRRSTGPRASSTSPSRAGGRRARHRRARARARRRLLAAGHDPRARRPDPAACAPTSWSSAPGCSAPRATDRGRAGLRAGDRSSTAESDWLVNEIRHYFKRTLKRLDVTSRSLVALIEPGRCFAGSLLELALAATASTCSTAFMEDDDEEGEPAQIVLSASNFGPLPMGNGLSRLQTRASGATTTRSPSCARRPTGRIDAAEALELGLVTVRPGRHRLGGRGPDHARGAGAASPDALTGMEANHRFVGPETMETQDLRPAHRLAELDLLRPNASGPDGALRRYGTGRRPTSTGSGSDA